MGKIRELQVEVIYEREAYGNRKKRGRKGKFIYVEMLARKRGGLRKVEIKMREQKRGFRWGKKNEMN